MILIKIYNIGLWLGFSNLSCQVGYCIMVNKLYEFQSSCYMYKEIMIFKIVDFVKFYFKVSIKVQDLFVINFCYGNFFLIKICFLW